MGNSFLRKFSRIDGASSFWGWAFQSHRKEQSDKRLWSATASNPTGSKRDGIFDIPSRTLQPFGSYPNLLNITPEMRQQFHPVVKIPRKRKGKQHGAGDNTDTCIESEKQQSRTFRWPWQRDRKDRHSRSNEIDSSCNAFSELKPLNQIYEYEVRDFTDSNKTGHTVLLNGMPVPQLVSSREEAREYAVLPPSHRKFDVGRYDEDRQNMYTSSLFSEEDETGDQTTQRRTVHVGLDLGCPVGTPVYAFADGVVHSAGYNPELGDYGHVVVVEHAISRRPRRGKKERGREEETNKVYALYGKCKIPC